MNIAGSTVPLTEKIKLLGVTIDENLSFNAHIAALCQASYYHIRALRHIRGSLTLNAAKSIACSLVASKIDYANSVLYGINAKNLNRLQVMQNSLARVVMNAPRLTSTKSLFEQLHWLPIQHRISYKVATLTYKCRNNMAPLYLSNMISGYVPSRTLRSSTQNQLVSSVHEVFMCPSQQSGTPSLRMFVLCHLSAFLKSILKPFITAKPF